MLSLRPLGGSLTTLSERCRMPSGKASVGSVVSHRRKSGCGLVTCNGRGWLSAGGVRAYGGDILMFESWRSRFLCRRESEALSARTRRAYLLEDLLKRLEPLGQQVAVLQHDPEAARGPRLDRLLRPRPHPLHANAVTQTSADNSPIQELRACGDSTTSNLWLAATAVKAISIAESASTAPAQHHRHHEQLRLRSAAPARAPCT